MWNLYHTVFCVTIRAATPKVSIWPTYRRKHFKRLINILLTSFDQCSNRHSKTTPIIFPGVAYMGVRQLDLQVAQHLHANLSGWVTRVQSLGNQIRMDPTWSNVQIHFGGFHFNFNWLNCPRKRWYCTIGFTNLVAGTYNHNTAEGAKVFVFIHKATMVVK